jgi:hypothetical protein
MGQPLPSPETLSVPTPFLRGLEFRLFDGQRLGFLADARRARAEFVPQANIVFQYGIDAQRVPL